MSWSEIRRDEARHLLHRAQQKFETEQSITMADGIGAYWQALAEAINEESRYTISPRFLQKELSAKIWKGKSDEHIRFLHKNIAAIYDYCKDGSYASFHDEVRAKDPNATLGQGIARIERYEREVSQNDISRPEFPVGNPAYPASPHYRLRYKHFKKIWIKDESFNPTGTHKDRMAWEVLRFYKEKLKVYLDHIDIYKAPPSLSIISSGAAAIAIQNLFSSHSLQFPPLKVLVDHHLDDRTKKAMHRWGCHVYQTDLSKRKLNSVDVCALTDNEENGIDITFNQGADLREYAANYYDWLSFEILNQNPDYCIVPVGSGGLLLSILKTLKNQLDGPYKDSRFFGIGEILRNCTFLGATCKSDHPRTIMDKLHAFHNRAIDLDLSPYRHCCNPNSRIVEVEDHYVEQALSIATKAHISSEPSGLAGLGLFIKLESSFPVDKKILIVNTGKLRLR